MTNSVPTFTVYRNRAFVGTVRAVSLKQAVKRAHARFGRCEVLGVNIARHADAFTHSDGARSERRLPCNRSLEAKEKLEAIRLQAIADWKASQ